MTATVLLVDDSRASRMLCAAIVKSLRPDLRILEAGDGSSALTLLETDEAQLAIVDMNMPGMSGLELTDHLRTRHPQMRLCLLTANVQEATQRRAAAAGVPFFRKPINETVIAHILALLD